MYSLDAKITNICLPITLAATNNWFLEQLDINHAFLHGDLKENFYMILSQVLNTNKPNQVCHLTKYLYSVKQASRQWYVKLVSSLHNLNFIQSPSYHFLFIKKIFTSFLALLVYVNDFLSRLTCLCERHSSCW